MRRTALPFASRLPVLAVAACALATLAHASTPAGTQRLRAGTVPVAGASHARALATADAPELPQYTGERLLDLPTTTPCTVTVATDYPFANTAYGPDPNFTGTLAPPADCPGPWSRVVATVSARVTGIQFDRVGFVTVGGVNIFNLSTPEPLGDSRGWVTWSKDKDVTEYAKLFAGPQPVEFSIGNVVTGPYTGIFYGTLTFRFYPADADNPAPATPDVLQVTDALVTGATPVSGEVTLPTNATRVIADLEAEGHGGCDEFWWADAPAPYPGQCGGAPLREIALYVDGRMAGLVVPYPYLFTGAGGPTWWEPISAPQTLAPRSWRLDLTPFVGLLADGKPHRVAAGMIDWNATSGNFFKISLRLLVDTDPQAGRTVGALLSAGGPAHATLDQTTSESAYTMHASHRFTATGWYRSPSGDTVTTSVSQAITADSDQVIDGYVVRNAYNNQQRVIRSVRPRSGKPTTTIATGSDTAVLNSLADGWDIADNGSYVVMRDGRQAFKSVRKDAMTSVFNATGDGVDSAEDWSHADTDGHCGTTHLLAQYPVLLSKEETGDCVW